MQPLVAVEKDVPDTILNWALYLADYVRYMNPVPQGLSPHLTDCNVSYQRKVLEEIANVWLNEFHEPEVHTALKERGGSLWLSPHIIVHQQRSMSLGNAIKDRYIFGRLFGGGRAQGITATLRLVHAAVAILLPPLLTARVANHVFRKRRCVTDFFRALPFLILLNTVWAWGEFVGTVTGQPEPSLTSDRAVG